MLVREFFAFLREYGVVGLAVAVVIGGKVNALVGSLVSDLVVPLLLQPALNAAGVDRIESLSAGGVLYGKVLGAMIEFLVTALGVFLFAKLILGEKTVAKR